MAFDLQFLLAEHGQNVVRVARTVHERLTRGDAVALLHVCDARQRRKARRRRLRYLHIGKHGGMREAVAACLANGGHPAGLTDDPSKIDK